MDNRRLSSASASLLVLLWAGFLLLMQLISGYLTPKMSAGWQQYLWTGIVELAFLLIPLAFVCRMTGRKVFSSLRAFPTGEGKAVLMAACLALTSYPVMLLVQNAWIFLRELMGATPQGVSLPDIGGPGELALALISVAGAAAFAEELCLRGVLLPALRGRMGPMAAAVLTAVIFALMHGSFSALPYTFLLGWLMGYLTLRSRTVYPAMAFHLTNNALATLISYWAMGLQAGQAQVEVTPLLRLQSLLALGNFALYAAALMAVLLYFYRRITPGVQPVPREERSPFWWAPMAAGAAVFAMLVVSSALYEFTIGG